MKTSELKDRALDWATGMAAGGPARLVWKLIKSGQWSPSDDWNLGGPIIEREGINLRAVRQPEHAFHGKWLATYDDRHTGTTVQRVYWAGTTVQRVYWAGPTPLIAAMRCYVAHKLGDEVDIPEELI